MSLLTYFAGRTAIRWQQSYRVLALAKLKRHTLIRQHTIDSSREYQFYKLVSQ